MAKSKSPALPRGWGPSGSHAKCYEMGIARDTFHSGSQCGYIKSTVDEIDGFSTLAQGMTAGQYAGHAIKLTAYVKSKDVIDWAGVWMRVDAGSSSVAFDNMQDRPIKGDTDWTRYELTLNVPDNSTSVCFGVLLSGTGEVWMDDFVLEKIEAFSSGSGSPGDIYRSCGVRYQIGHATNLDFSQGLRAETEDPCLAAVPNGWFKQDHGSVPCLVGVEKAIGASGTDVVGAAAFIQSEHSDGHGSLLQAVATADYVGKRVKLSARVKTAKVVGEAILFYRADVDRALAVTFDHMEKRELSGDNDWAEYYSVIDIPADSDNIYFGGALHGRGTVWLSDFNLTVVSAKVKTTGKNGAIKKAKAPLIEREDPSNLDFNADGAAVKTIKMPSAWVSAGSAPKNYKMGLAPDVVLDGQRCAVIQNVKADENHFGTLMQTACARQFLGKRLRFKAQIKTADSDWTALWLRIDGADRKLLGFDNMHQNPIKGTTDWNHYECVLDVPEEAINIAFGILQNGGGSAWMSKVVLEIVGDDVETTAAVRNGGNEATAVNLDFEEV